MSALFYYHRLLRILWVVCIFVAVEFHPFFVAVVKGQAPLPAAKDNGIYIGSGSTSESSSEGDGSSTGESSSSSSSGGSGGSSSGSSTSGGAVNSATNRASVVETFHHTGYDGPLAILLGFGVLLAVFGTYWQWRKKRQQQDQLLISTVQRSKSRRNSQMTAAAAAPLMSGNVTKSKTSESDPSSTTRSHKHHALVDSITTTTTGTGPTSGTYRFTYYKDGLPFQSTSHLRFEPSDTDAKTWKIFGHGKDADGEFSITEGSVSGSTGNAQWVEKSKDRLVLNTGTFNFVNNKFSGGWKLSNHRGEATLHDFQLLTRQDSSTMRREEVEERC
ncbi:hypothetical protein ACA910_019099 [Epithemia clementina (nom. ined.)]